MEKRQLAVATLSAAAGLASAQSSNVTLFGAVDLACARPTTTASSNSRRHKTARLPAVSGFAAPNTWAPVWLPASVGAPRRSEPGRAAAADAGV